MRLLWTVREFALPVGLHGRQGEVRWSFDPTSWALGRRDWPARGRSTCPALRRYVHLGPLHLSRSTDYYKSLGNRVIGTPPGGQEQTQ